MADFSYSLAEEYVKRCQRELRELLDFSGVVVVDNSFPNGFLQRRMFREGFYPTVSEAFYAETLFQEGFYQGLPDNVTFPAEMRREHKRGVEKLIEGIDDPATALVSRWGGPKGEPPMVAYKIIPADEDDTRHAQKNMGALVKVLRFGSHVHNTMPSEAHVVGKDVHKHAATVRHIKNRNAYLDHITDFAGHYRRQPGRICQNHSFQEIPSRPLYAVGSNPRNENNDSSIFALCRTISESTPVLLVTGDFGFKRKHDDHYLGANNTGKDYGITVLHDGPKYVSVMPPANID